MVVADPRCFRATEVETLLGAHQGEGEAGMDAAHHLWGDGGAHCRRPLSAEMMENDLQLARRDALVKEAGYRAVD